MNSTAYFEAWKYPKSSLVGIKPGRRLNKTQAELQRMIREFTESENSLRNDNNDVRDLVSIRNKGSRHNWDCEAAKLEKPV